MVEPCHDGGRHRQQHHDVVARLCCCPTNTDFPDGQMRCCGCGLRPSCEHYPKGGIAAVLSVKSDARLGRHSLAQRCIHPGTNSLQPWWETALPRGVREASWLLAWTAVWPIMGVSAAAGGFRVDALSYRWPAAFSCVPERKSSIQQWHHGLRTPDPYSLVLPAVLNWTLKTPHPHTRLVFLCLTIRC